MSDAMFGALNREDKGPGNPLNTKKPGLQRIFESDPWLIPKKFLTINELEDSKVRFSQLGFELVEEDGNPMYVAKVVPENWTKKVIGDTFIEISNSAAQDLRYAMIYNYRAENEEVRWVLIPV